MKALLLTLTNSDNSAKQVYLQLGNGMVCISANLIDHENQDSKKWLEEFNSKADANDGKFAGVMPLDFYADDTIREDLEVVELSDKHKFIRIVDDLELILAGVRTREQYEEYAKFDAEPYE